MSWVLQFYLSAVIRSVSHKISAQFIWKKSDKNLRKYFSWFKFLVFHFISCQVFKCNYKKLFMVLKTAKSARSSRKELERWHDLIHCCWERFVTNDIRDNEVLWKEKETWLKYCTNLALKFYFTFSLNCCKSRGSSRSKLLLIEYFSSLFLLVLPVNSKIIKSSSFAYNLLTYQLFLGNIKLDRMSLDRLHRCCSCILNVSRSIH